MALNPFFSGLDSTVSAGKFFADLTLRLADGTLAPGEDAVQLSRSLGVPIPAELAGASIVSLGGRHDVGRSGRLRARSASRQIVIVYPPVAHPGFGQEKLTVKKCWNVCQTVAGRQSLR